MADEASLRADAMSPAALGVLFGIENLPQRMAAIERRLARGTRQLGDVLTDATREAIASPGKRLRPMLTVVCAELGGAFDDRVVDAAAAIELIQVGSLIHDDVIEEATLRRGRATVNATDGMAVGVVAGDLVLSAAAAMAAGLGAAPAVMLSQGLVDMATGQLSEMKDLFKQDRTVEQHMKVIQAKTGALFASACRLGAWCADLPATQQDAMTRYGLSFGIGYQALDDLLDVVGDPERLGKPVGVDLRSGVYTVPTLVALRRRGGKTLSRLLERRGPDDLAEARTRIAAGAVVEETIEIIRQWMSEASRATRRLPNSPTAEGLAAFPQKYLSWALAEFVRDA